MPIDFDNIQTVTPQQQLKAVNYAIAQLTLGGQSVTLPNGKSVTYSSLADLRALKTELEQQIARDSGSYGVGHFGFRR